MESNRRPSHYHGPSEGRCKRRRGSKQAEHELTLAGPSSDQPSLAAFCPPQCPLNDQRLTPPGQASGARTHVRHLSSSACGLSLPTGCATPGTSLRSGSNQSVASPWLCKEPTAAEYTARWWREASTTHRLPPGSYTDTLVRRVPLRPAERKLARPGPGHACATVQERRSQRDLNTGPGGAGDGVVLTQRAGSDRHGLLPRCRGNPGRLAVCHGNAHVASAAGAVEVRFAGRFRSAAARSDVSGARREAKSAPFACACREARLRL